MYLIKNIKEISSMKFIIMISLVLFGMCVWMDSTPSEAVVSVSEWINDMGDTMEGGFND